MGKFNDDQMISRSGSVGDVYEQMSQELMFNLINRIKQRGSADLQREPWLWQLEKLNDMHMLNEQNVKYILDQTGIAKDLFDDIIKNEGLKVYKNTQEQLAEELGKNPPFNDVKSALDSYAQQAFRDVDNLVNQTLLSSNFDKNPVMKTYQSIIETSVGQVVSGVKTADQAVNDTVMKWISKGFPSNFVDKAGRQWSIDSYVRMVTQSTTFRVYNDMRTRASEELGVETFYYSKHGASRPACALIQGKVVTKGQSFHSKTLGYTVESLKEHGWGTAGGALGVNCKHYLTPFIIGVNNLPDVPDHLKDITPKQAIENGRKQAQQRAYERAIKDDKYKLQAAKLLGDDRRVARYQNRLGIHRSSLNDLLKENSFLHRSSAREKIYKSGRTSNKSIKDYFKNSNMKDMVGSKNYSAFLKKFNSIDNSSFKKLLQKMSPQIEFGVGKESTVDNVVYLTNKAFNSSHNKVAMQSVFHEMSHAMDNLGVGTLGSDFDRVSQMPEYKLKKDINDDLLNLFNSDLQSINGSDYQKLKSLKKMSIFDQGAIVRKYKKLAEENPLMYSALSDMMESTGAFTDHPLGNGHGFKYWKTSGNQEAEFFAHMAETVVNKDARKMMYELFPTAARKWEKMLNDILDSMK